MPNSKAKTPIEVRCDEDGQTFVCFGTLNKRKALAAMRNFMEVDCGLDKSELPKLDDLTLSPLWYGLNPDEKENWHYWASPPKNSKYMGSCWRFDF